MHEICGCTALQCLLIQVGALLDKVAYVCDVDAYLINIIVERAI